jgi:asparagine synthase (glutamine-hydrolysing)
MDSLGAVAWHYDEPFADAAAVPLFLLSREAVNHVKVVLTGEGSDELFAGYRRVSVERFAAAYGLLPAAVRRWISSAAGTLPRARRLKQALAALANDGPAERYASWLTVFTGEMRAGLLLQAEAAETDVLGHYRRYVNPDLDPVTRALYCDFKTWLPDTYLEKVDKATMAFGLEARVPFLDRRLVEFAFTLPPHLKIAGFDTKHILKRALRRVLPESIRQRRKHGFAVPLDPWFRGPLREQVQSVITDSRTRQRGMLRPEYLAALARDHWSGAHVRHAHLYQVLMLELWCRTYLDGKPERITV